MPLTSAPAPVERMGGRKPVPGPELNMINEALEAGIPLGNRNPSLIFREPLLPSGYPDLISTSLMNRVITSTSVNESLTRTEAKLAHYIYERGGGAIADLQNELSFTKKTAQDSVSGLLSKRVIRRRGDYLRCRSGKEVFAITGITAIEAKVSDWKSCMRQAMGNRWFSSRSYILIPRNRVTEEVKIAAGRFGIGILCFDGKKVTRPVMPAKSRFPASYCSWIINDWAVEALASGP